jgi:hypothetical protein
MNGAELPCGSVLQVEPADSNYSQKQRPAEESERSAKESEIVPPHDESKPESKTEVQPADDLDEFFDSL